MAKPTPNILPHGWYHNQTTGGDGNSHYAARLPGGWMWGCCAGEYKPFSPGDTDNEKLFHADEPYWQKGRSTRVCPECWRKYGVEGAVRDLLDES